MRKFTTDEMFDVEIEDENSTKEHGNPTTTEECLSVWLSYDRFVYGDSND